MKKRLAVWVLLFLFVAAGGYLFAQLWCYQLADCSGAAGCALGGSVNGCVITCIGGGSAHCPKRT
jgi:hypothetical protein